MVQERIKDRREGERERDSIETVQVGNDRGNGQFQFQSESKGEREKGKRRQPGYEKDTKRQWIQDIPVVTELGSV